MLQTKRKILSLNQTIIVLLMFLAGMNMFAKHFYFIFAAFAISLFVFRDTKLNGTLFVLLIFSLSYIIFYDFFSSGIMGMLRRLGFPMCYFVGYNFILRDSSVIEDETKPEYNMIFPIMAMPLGAVVHFFINYLLNRGSEERNNIDVWTNEIMSATGQGALAILGIGVFVALIFSNYKKIVKILAVIGLTLILLYNLVLAGRTILIITIGLLLIGCAYKLRHSNSEKKTKILFAVIALVLLAIIAYSNNWFGLRDIITDSNLFKRFEEENIKEDQRGSLKMQYLKNLFLFPWGGGRLNDFVGGYAHDLFLDAYSDAGIITVVFLLAFVIASIAQTVKFVLKTTASYNIKLMVICVNIAALACFLVEPIMQGMAWMFSSYCFIQGVVAKGNFCLKNNISKSNEVT